MPRNLPVKVEPSSLSVNLDRGSIHFFDEHLRRLRALPAHGNRTLHYHHLFVALLLSFFSPTVRSQRFIEGCGDFNGKLDLDRLARSTTSDALAAFDPEHLKPIIRDLQKRVGDVRRADASLAGITQRIIAGDGSYLNTLASVT